MFNPPHPGETLREDVLPALGLTVTEAARQLGVSRVALSRALNGKAAISPDMARRLEAWLGGPDHGPSAESWLRGQLAYDSGRRSRSPAPKFSPPHSHADGTLPSTRKGPARHSIGPVTGPGPGSCSDRYEEAR